MRVSERRLRRIIRSIIVENDQKKISMTDPPEIMDFYISDDADIYPRKEVAINSAPRDFVNYGGEGQLFKSEDDFISKMLRKIKNDINYIFDRLDDYAEDMLNQAYLALFKNTSYKYSGLENLKRSLEVNDESLMTALKSLYSMNGNWSNYFGYQESAFA
mgnify:CR=1 FL=1|tara:strand:- start:42 stop:521 length:480 start_codon:yes stop_codon:yes gene_type:complete